MKRWTGLGLESCPFLTCPSAFYFLPCLKHYHSPSLCDSLAASHCPSRSLNHLHISSIVNSCNLHDALTLCTLGITNSQRAVTQHIKSIPNPREFSQDSDSSLEFLFENMLVWTCTFFVFQINFAVTCTLHWLKSCVLVSGLSNPISPSKLEFQI